jgi:pyrroloquinoline quinone biosynthesis protein B
MIQVPDSSVSAVVLGIMQDGGLPHAGCRCQRCWAVFDQGAAPELAASLAIIDRRTRETAVWFIDATPDIKHQINLLAHLLGPHPQRPDRLRQPDGVFLTHAHVGHIGGLPQFGPEVMAADQLPVYGAPPLVSLLSETRLWRPLLRNLHLVPLPANQPMILAPRLHITPVPVPHRDEWGIGTFAYLIQGPTRALLYLPDIDAWELWPMAREQLATVDLALVDACFYSNDELGGRRPVAHPLVPQTLELFANIPGRLILTHLNHTNPLLDVGSKQHRAVVDAGVIVAQTGDYWQL